VIPDEAVEADYLVTVLYDADEGDGFERLGTFLVRACHEDEATEKGFQEARRIQPEVMDMQLDSVTKAAGMIVPGGDLRFIQPINGATK